MIQKFTHPSAVSILVGDFRHQQMTSLLAKVMLQCQFIHPQCTGIKLIRLVHQLHGALPGIVVYRCQPDRRLQRPKVIFIGYRALTFFSPLAFLLILHGLCLVFVCQMPCEEIVLIDFCHHRRQRRKVCREIHDCHFRLLDPHRFALRLIVVHKDKRVQTKVQFLRYFPNIDGLWIPVCIDRRKI